MGSSSPIMIVGRRLIFAALGLSVRACTSAESGAVHGTPRSPDGPWIRIQCDSAHGVETIGANRNSFQIEDRCAKVTLE